MAEISQQLQADIEKWQAYRQEMFEKSQQYTGSSAESADRNVGRAEQEISGLQEAQRLAREQGGYTYEELKGYAHSIAEGTLSRWEAQRQAKQEAQVQIVKDIQSQYPDRFKPVYVGGRLTGFQDVIAQKSIPIETFYKGYSIEQPTQPYQPTPSPFQKPIPILEKLQGTSKEQAVQIYEKQIGTYKSPSGGKVPVTEVYARTKEGVERKAFPEEKKWYLSQPREYQATEKKPTTTQVLMTERLREGEKTPITTRAKLFGFGAAASVLSTIAFAGEVVKLPAKLISKPIKTVEEVAASLEGTYKYVTSGQLAQVIREQPEYATGYGLTEIGQMYAIGKIPKLVKAIKTDTNIMKLKELEKSMIYTKEYGYLGKADFKATPLRFDLEVNLGLDELKVAKLTQKLAETKGFDYKGLSEIDKDWLKGQVGARARAIYPEVPTTRKVTITKAKEISEADKLRDFTLKKIDEKPTIQKYIELKPKQTEIQKLALERFEQEKLFDITVRKLDIDTKITKARKIISDYINEKDLKSMTLEKAKESGRIEKATDIAFNRIDIDKKMGKALDLYKSAKEEINLKKITVGTALEESRIEKATTTLLERKKPFKSIDIIKDIDKEFLKGQVKARMRMQPEKLIPTARQMTLQLLEKPKLIPKEKLIVMKDIMISKIPSLKRYKIQQKLVSVTKFDFVKPKVVSAVSAKSLTKGKMLSSYIFTEPVISRARMIPLYKQRQRQQQILTERAIEKTADLPVITQIKIPRQRALTIQKEIARQDSALMSASASRAVFPSVYQFERAISRQMPRTIQRFREKPLQLLEYRFKKKKKLWGFQPKKKISRLLSEPSFEVFVIEKKKPRTIARGLPKEIALDIGTRAVARGLRATFGIRQTNEPMLREITTGREFARYRDLFREPALKSPYRKYGEVYVQKKTKVGKFGKGRLTFRGERKEIQMARLRKLMKGGLK